MAAAYVNKGAAGYVYPHTTTITPALPASIVPGNLLLACVMTITNGASAHTWPAGWTPLDAQITAAGIRSSVAYRIATGSDAAPTVSWTSASIASGQIFQLTGTSASPIGAFGSAFGSTSTHSSPSIATTANDALVVYLDASFSGTVLPTPAGWTARSSDPDGWDTISIGDKIVATGGTATGAIAVTAASSGWVEWQIEILADPNSIGASTLDLPTILASSAAITNTLASSSQVLTAILATGSAYSGNESVAVLERILASSAAITDSIGTSDQTLPSILASGEATQGPVATASLTLLSMTLSSSAITGVAGVGAITLALPTLTAYASSDPIPALAPMTLNATAITGSAGIGNITLPDMVLNATVMDIVEADLVLQSLSVSAIAVTGSIGAGSITLPTMTLAAIAYIETVGAGSIVMPLMLLNAVAAQQAFGAGYITVSMDTGKQALTAYTNYPFNSFCMFGGELYGASDAGLFKLTGATDNGTAIAATFTGGVTDFGDSHLKTIDRAYVGYRTDGDLTLSLTQHDDGAVYTYRLASNTMPGIFGRRVITGRGLRARYYQWSISNVDGADFSIDTLELSARTLSRRIGGKDA